MRIGDVMTRDVTVIGPQDTVQRAAQLMDDLNVGVLPVCDGNRILGMLTDRDIVVRSIAAGQAPESARVGDLMTDEVHWCFEDDDVGDVLGKMAGYQIRRIPVVDGDKQLVGIVSLGDLAADPAAVPAAIVEDALTEISTPAEPDR